MPVKSSSVKKSRPASAANAQQPTPIKAPRPEYPAKDLTHIQQELVAIFVDMLLHGPVKMADLDHVLLGLIGHYQRWRYHCLPDEPEKSLERWRLAVLQSTTTAPERVNDRFPDPDESAPAREIFRANLLDSLSYELDNFLRSSSPEEQFILRELLRRREGDFMNYPTYDEHEIPILSAFQIEIDSHHLVRVPSDIEAQVKSYVDLLLEAKKGKAA
ncbi:MAG: hypothetical protein IT168_05900 [Bryobacterales bacterium]|nr:hypothetical protein [Bryobacterales bacterium]